MERAQDGDRISGADVREARFPQERRGYDREAVHAFLDRVADWVEATAGGAAETTTGLTSEFAKVGERTAGILTAAEEAAAKLRREAKEYADHLRTSTEEETRKATLNATQKADELISEAESKAEGIIDEAIARRRRLNQAVASLIERREEIADGAQQLADQLLEAVEAIRADEPIPHHDDDEEVSDGDEPVPTPPRGAFLHGDDPESHAERSRLQRAGFIPAAPQPGEPTELDPPDQRDTTIHEGR